MEGNCEVFRTEGASFFNNLKSGGNKGRNHRRNEEGHLDIFVELELAQVASIVSMRIFGDGTLFEQLNLSLLEDKPKSKLGSPKQHEPPFVPILEALKEVDQKARKGAVNESPISFVKQYCTAQ
ncbi:hypothetical protein H5410_056883 [Solanum commersonii]|uniref:Uncharacterized protein n=1 Tax=Solanum commersonii TaxID=4109 RepID=A0A9J5WN21_SOLCO|nr:hypothetical protein H5410_056883 [Solanum commersonii]